MQSDKKKSKTGSNRRTRGARQRGGRIRIAAHRASLTKSRVEEEIADGAGRAFDLTRGRGHKTLRRRKKEDIRERREEDRKKTKQKKAIPSGKEDSCSSEHWANR
jgi:hypothetical protein